MYLLYLLYVVVTLIVLAGIAFAILYVVLYVQASNNLANNPPWTLRVAREMMSSSPPTRGPRPQPTENLTARATAYVVPKHKLP